MGSFVVDAKNLRQTNPPNHPEPIHHFSHCEMFENTLKIPFGIVFSKRRALTDTLEISRLQGGSTPSGTYLRRLCPHPTNVLELKSCLDSTFRTLSVHYFEFHWDKFGTLLKSTCCTLRRQVPDQFHHRGRRWPEGAAQKHRFAEISISKVVFLVVFWCIFRISEHFSVFKTLWKRCLNLLKKIPSALR